MDNYVIELKRGVIKKINDINQIIKKLAKEYYITHEGLVIFNKDTVLIDKGIHYSIIKNIESLPLILNSDYIIKLNSDIIFTVLKDNKTAITKLFIEDRSIILEKDSKYICIGEYIPYDNFNDITNEIKIINSLNDKDYIVLCDETATKLLTNHVVFIHEEDYRIKITREVLPEIKKTTIIEVSFKDNPDMSSDIEDIYEATFKTEVDSIINFHTYFCLK